MILRASAPFSYGLWSVGGFDGLDGLNGRLFRGCGGGNATGVHGGFLELDGQLGGQLDGQLGGQLGGQISCF